MRQIHVIVSGRVQGVGFRFFAQQAAAEHNTVGSVQNKEDGSVVIKAQGEDNDIEAFLDQIRKGPSTFAKVKNLEITEENVSDKFNKFEIKY
ncbi:acylphosphatase [Gracilibacillus salinarum]|uniref:acylphosphatase n=1 Tax=Gracilibacillus salinarum TaxID=2932255 RepID=A0ABY4GNM8_9BACI|nr:acylphosphatase [Gracilibacillus salinarum]UOQ85819.1 acylphosphatase [Gracilibacillus salinarum]